MKHWVVAVGLVALTGCAAQDHYYSSGVCVTCLNNPVTGEPLNYDPSETPQKVATNAEGQTVDARSLGSQSGSIDITSRVDVDTAYARIKSAMGFRSPGDFESPESTTAKMQMGDIAWKHDRTPGAYYNLGDYGRQTLGGRRYSILQRVQIEKSGAGSRIQYSWAPADPRALYDGGAMESLLMQRLNAALD